MKFRSSDVGPRVGRLATSNVHLRRGLIVVDLGVDLVYKIKQLLMMDVITFNENKCSLW